MQQDFARQLLEKTRRDYDAIASSFSETRKRTYDLQPLVVAVKSGDRVLDIGCGNGRLLDVLPVGVQYTGCDTSERMTELAEKRRVIQLPSVQFAICDVLSLPFPNASFDHVFALAVLHHIPSSSLRQRAVAELARVCAPGGHVIVTVWNLRSWYWIRRYKLWRLFFGLHPKGYDHGDCFIPWKRKVAQPILRYAHAFTRRELRRLFIDAGLSLMRLEKGYNYTVIAERHRV